jgi:hypothetical protein
MKHKAHKRSKHSKRGSRRDGIIVTESEGATSSLFVDQKRQLKWRVLLGERPPSDDEPNMSAWLLRVMAVSDRKEPLLSSPSPPPPRDTPPSSGDSKPMGILGFADSSMSNSFGTSIDTSTSSSDVSDKKPPAKEAEVHTKHAANPEKPDPAYYFSDSKSSVEVKERRRGSKKRRVEYTDLWKYNKSGFLNE